jgi:Protein of unknown function (DUF3047)
LRLPVSNVRFVVAVLFLTPVQPLFQEGFGPGWEGRWKSRDFRGKPQEARIEDDGDGNGNGGNPVLRLDSSRSAGAYFAAVSGEPREVSFRWKVDSGLTGRDSERSRRGDDYAARVFVLFDPPPLDGRTRAICYVWAREEPRESLYPSPYFTRVGTLVLESGADRANEWVSERRVIGDDFRRFFGSAPPPVRAVAVMVDSDDTRGRATAWFDDIVLR